MTHRIERTEAASQPLTIAVLGLGHVGLPTALGLASLGWDVVGADENPQVVQGILNGKPSFFEPGLNELLAEQLQRGRFAATADVTSAVRSATIIFVCVGTPQRENGEADLSQVEGIARIIGKNLNGYKLIVEKSTVPVVTAFWIKKTVERFAQAQFRLFEKANGADGDHRPNGASSIEISFDVASNPEFLQEGRAVEDFFHPWRVVIGVESDKARALLEAIYRPLDCPIVVADLATSELIKHSANAFLATKISFINMVSDICDAVGADVATVGEGLGLDPRIGPQFLKAGIGFGGYCFPKDLRAFTFLAKEHGLNDSLLRAVEQINQQRVEVFLRKLRQALWVLQGKTIGVLGLAFKPATDDVREAPSLKILDAILKEGAAVRLYDPKAMANVRQIFPEHEGIVSYCSSPYEVAHGAHAVLLLTEWDEFRSLDLPRMRNVMEVPVLVDGRNLYDSSTVREAGFEYVCMGRSGGAPLNAEWFTTGGFYAESANGESAGNIHRSGI